MPSLIVQWPAKMFPLSLLRMIVKLTKIVVSFLSELTPLQLVENPGSVFRERRAVISPLY